MSADSLSPPVTAVNAARTYHPLFELGKGGMATVTLSVLTGPEGFEKLAVVKRPRASETEEPGDASSQEMFKEEARVAAALSHPNIVHTYEIFFDHGTPLLAMEYLEGVSYHKLMRSRLEFGHRLTVLIEVLKGLEYLHTLRDISGNGQPVIHRDISPPNILVTYCGQVKVLDFGIAKRPCTRLATDSGLIKGKVAYMSPEQARGDTVDARTDLYAVGVMLWEAVAGRSRWSSTDERAAICNLIKGDAPPAPAAAARGLPEALDSIALQALAPQPDDRFQSAADFRKCLEAVRGECTTNAQPSTGEPRAELGAQVGRLFAEHRAKQTRRIGERIDEWKSSLPDAPLPPVAGSESIGANSGYAPQGSAKRPKLQRLLLAACACGVAIGGVAFARKDAGPPELEAIPLQEKQINAGAHEAVGGERATEMQGTARPETLARVRPINRAHPLNSIELQDTTKHVPKAPSSREPKTEIMLQARLDDRADREASRTVPAARESRLGRPPVVSGRRASILKHAEQTGAPKRASKPKGKSTPGLDLNDPVLTDRR